MAKQRIQTQIGFNSLEDWVNLKEAFAFWRQQQGYINPKTGRKYTQNEFLLSIIEGEVNRLLEFKKPKENK